MAKTGRGGKREGAGRPRTDSKLYTFRAPGRLVPLIESQDNKTEFIRDCIWAAVTQAEPDLSQIGDVYRPAQDSDTIPFFDIQVAAGFPIPLDNDERAESIHLTSMLCPHPESCYVIRVKGDSMIDANIFDGDTIIVDKSNRNPTPRQVAMCEHNGEYTIKFVETRKDGIWLVPANEAYHERHIDEGDRFSVWGVVTYVLHKPTR